VFAGGIVGNDRNLNVEIVCIPAYVPPDQTRSVEGIAKQAFLGNKILTSIRIPASVNSIGEDSFSSCSNLTSINVAEDNLNYLSEDGVLYNKAKTTLIAYPIGKKSTSFTVSASVTIISIGAFHRCDNLTNIYFAPNSQLETIGFAAFDYCTSLTNIEIPASVTIIGDSAFFLCENLANVNFSPNSQLKTIVQSAFQNCYSLTSITIPAGVTSIAREAFLDCNNLREVTFLGDIVNIANDDSFPNGASLSLIYPAEGAGTYVRDDTEWEKR
jgi:hypothetical protein